MPGQAYWGAGGYQVPEARQGGGSHLLLLFATSLTQLHPRHWLYIPTDFGRPSPLLKALAQPCMPCIHAAGGRAVNGHTDPRPLLVCSLRPSWKHSVPQQQLAELLVRVARTTGGHGPLATGAV